MAIPQALRPKLYWDHPVMSAEEIRSRTQGVWDAFYSWGPIWRRSSFIKSSKGRLAFVLISRIYRQMYADTGIATDSARVTWSGRWTRIMAKPCRRLFAGKPMPDLKTPEHAGEFVSARRLGECVEGKHKRSRRLLIRHRPQIRGSRWIVPQHRDGQTHKHP